MRHQMLKVGAAIVMGCAAAMPLVAASRAATKPVAAASRPAAGPVAATSEGTATVGTAAAVARPYRIKPGDVLDVYVWGEDRLSRDIKVLPDGTISFPLVGQIVAANRLPRDVEADITAGLKPKYRDTVPQVTVSVKDAVGMQFSIVGKVHQPGAFNTGRYINVLEAVALAGGPADFADMGNVRILRKGASGNLSVIKVRLSDVLKGNVGARDVAELPEIESGDTVVVP